MTYLQLLFEMETIAEELASSRMSRKQQGRVVKIRHCLGVIAGCFTNENIARNDLQRCLHSLIKIQMLSQIALESRGTKQVRKRFGDLLVTAGNLESWIHHELQNPGIMERLRTLVRIVTSWIL